MSKHQVSRKTHGLSERRMSLAGQFADDTVKTGQEYAKEGVKQGQKLGEQAFELGKDKGEID